MGGTVFQMFFAHNLSLYLRLHTLLNTQMDTASEERRTTYHI